MQKSILVDTSLLLLLIVGLTDRRLIEQHKNLGDYDEDGFDLLVEKLQEFSEIILTPNTLTETSNLLRQIRDPHRESLMRTLRKYIQGHAEYYIRSEDASGEAVFLRLGLADAAMMRAARQQIVLLSADYKLYVSATQEGFEAYNFAHLYDAKFG